MHRESAVLGRPPGVAAVDRVIHRALAKAAADRYATAADMAGDLRATAKSAMGLASSVPARAVSRLIVLPFRLLRPDPEIDFLSQSAHDDARLSRRIATSGVPARTGRVTPAASAPLTRHDSRSHCRQQVATAMRGPDKSRVARVRFNLAAQPHDGVIHRAGMR